MPAPKAAPSNEEDEKKKAEAAKREEDANRLLNYAKSFENSRPDEAVTKYQELRDKFPDSRAWKEGEARYKALVERLEREIHGK